MTLDAASLAVLGDAREERGLGRVPLWAQEVRAYADADDASASASAYAADDASAYASAYAADDASAYASAYAADDASADADADASAYADADADASASADADADAFADASASAYADAEQPIRRTAMKNGLYAVSLTQSGRTVLRVGWFHRDPSDPDEYETVWSTIYRGEYQTKLGEVWAKGPKTAPAWTWGTPVPSVAHRIHFQPLARLDAKLWASVCPRPEGWE